MLPIDSFPHVSTVTWFGRSDMQLVAVLNALADSTVPLGLLALGSGPLEWTVLADPRLHRCVMVDISPIVERFLWRLVCREMIPLSELAAVCRNSPDEENIDLHDREHVAQGFKKLSVARTLPAGWDISSSVDFNFVSLPEDYFMFCFSRQDVFDFLRSNDEPFTVVQIGNLVTQLLKSGRSVSEMDEFYRRVMTVGPLAVHLQTTVGHFRDQNSVVKSGGWPHFLDQIQSAGMMPQAVALVDAVLHSGQLRGSYSVICAAEMALDLLTWKQEFEAKWGVQVLHEELEDIEDSWCDWEKQNVGDRFVLALCCMETGVWEQLSISEEDMRKVLTTSDKLVYGRNMYDGLKLFCPNYQP